VTLIVEPDAEFAATLSFALGEDVRQVDSPVAAGRDLDEHPEELLVVIGPHVDQAKALELAAGWQVERPHVGVVLLRRRIDVQVLGEALRAGVREVVGPEDLGAVVAAARRSTEISRRRRATELAVDGSGSRDAYVVTVFSAKGGCGKTTVATNLAAVLAADSSTRVCLVDLDLEFGDVAIALQVLPERTVIDLLPMVGTMDEHGVRSVITPAGQGIDTVLAPTRPGEAGRVDPAVVPELIRVLRRMYDVVVIDTPPAISEHVLAAFDLADTTVLLATLDVPALKNLRVSMDTLDLLGYPKESRLIVLNRADAQVGLEISDVEQTIGAPVTVRVPSSGDVPASINRGRLIVREQPDHEVSRALSELAARIRGIQPEPATAARSGGLRSLLRRGGAR
jgi:pilus assembly protein CpaE